VSNSASLTVFGLLKVYSGGALTASSGATLNAHQLDLSSASGFSFPGGTITIGSAGFATPTGGATVGDGTSAATLQLSYSTVSNGPLTIANNSTLGGFGTFSVPVTINAGGTVAPNSAPGQMTFASGLTLASAGSAHAVLQLGLGGDPTIPGNAGATFDQIVLSGGVFTVGGATLQIIPFADVVLDEPYPIVTATGGSIDASSVFSNLTNGTLYDNGGLEYQVTYSSDEIDVTFDSVPEPASLSWLALPGLMLRRRRRQKARPAAPRD
jgi:hypothetical protein